MAMSLAAFNGARPARRRRRSGSPTRAASPRPGPTTSRRCSRSPRRVPGAIPVLTIDGPTASGKGTLASAVAAALGYVLPRLRARLPRDGASRRCRRGVDADDEAALEALAQAPWTCASTAGRTCLGGADVTDSLRLEEVGALASRISAWPARARRRRSACRLSFRRLPGLVADGRDMGTRRLPRRRRSRSSSPRAPPNAPSGGTSS